MNRNMWVRVLSLLMPIMLIGATACSSSSEGGGSNEPDLTAAQIALATDEAKPQPSAPIGAGGLTAADVLQRAGAASATLKSFRFKTETVVTSGDGPLISTVTGEWSLPGRYRATMGDPDDPIEDFIVADGRLIHREGGTDEWRLETEFDPGLGIGSGQIIPAMDVFEYSDPLNPDDGEVYRITGAEKLDIPGIATNIVQTHELVIRISDFHIESVVSFINPNPEIGLEGTWRTFVVYDRNMPEQIVIPEVVIDPAAGAGG
ncbi:MAG: hypothetical protein OTJ98_05585 [Dehalococcoidia bacterium]|nr:hypothetical protein [Dehalococcoidia bacterium]